MGLCNFYGDKTLKPKFPNNVNARNFQKLEEYHDQWWFRVREEEGCDAPEIVYSPEVIKDSKYLDQAPKKGGPPHSQVVNVDHAYEKAILSFYLESLFPNDDMPECSTFLNLFLLTPDAGSSLLDDQTELIYALWARMGMSIQIIHNPTYLKIYLSSQNDIYAGLLRFDEIWNSQCNYEPFRFAAKYEAYIANLYKENSASMIDMAGSYSSILFNHVVPTDLQGEANSWHAKLTNILPSYPPASMTFPSASLMVTYTATTVADIRKRQAACTPSAQSTPATGIASTTTLSASLSTFATLKSSPRPTSMANSTSTDPAAASAAFKSYLSEAGGILASAASAAHASSISEASAVSQASAASVAYAASSVSAASAASSASAASAASAASTSAATATPTTDCYLWDDLSVAYAIEITPMNSWSLPSGASLHQQLKGCGTVTDWQFGNWTNGTQWASFDIDILIKSGCIERAIHSAGGPQGLKCAGMGFFDDWLGQDDSVGMGAVELVEIEGSGEDGDEEHGGPTRSAAAVTAIPTRSILPLAIPA
ncbi:hypothetical protein K490DRAFT_55682 [Saccharata proteae CBS 121410]|uniref:Uncharacterized protein n=1 Tax=Saccharata proteae CBS 121410 TaxID=1314787 RepID=A0A6A5YC52_9PEZI|nr:hypothetical protein K490DRAFT_55682 [Saccharata proteae CBS 121410]